MRFLSLIFPLKSSIFSLCKSHYLTISLLLRWNSFQDQCIDLFRKTPRYSKSKLKVIYNNRRKESQLKPRARFRFNNHYQADEKSDSTRWRKCTVKTTPEKKIMIELEKYEVMNHTHRPTRPTPRPECTC